MIAVNDPRLGAATARSIQPPPVIRSVATPYVAPSPSTAPASAPPQPFPTPVLLPMQTTVPPEQLPVQVQGPVAVTGETVSTSGSPGGLPVELTNIIDPVTGISYSGYLTSDAQTLYQSGSLLTGGNQLTTQGSALAAQGDLISGTPAPTAAQIAQSSLTTTAPAAAPATDVFSEFETWLSAQTYWAGVPNGALLAGGVIALAWLMGGRKKRR
jgi:hypothetical protein